MTFEEFGLHNEIMKGIGDSGYTTPTPIQEMVMRKALDGADILGSAETGSGKTAAFLLPILNKLLDSPPGFRCLILEPTRELAIQVNSVAAELAAHTKLKSVVVFGGAPVNTQISKIKGGADIIVATPGRLIDLAWSGHLDFGGIAHLVVDEVDHMFDMGFIDDVNQIISYLPQTPYQKMFFSATMPDEVMKLIKRNLVNPEIVSIGRKSKPAEGITHELYIVDRDDKYKALRHILKNSKIGSAIIFSETKHGADRLYKLLRGDGFDVSPFHSGFDQVARYDILKRFRAGRVRILVATNVAARGLDITGISHIFNFDVPPASEDYIHRIGRSARADATGTAITLAYTREANSIRKIEELIQMTLPIKQIEGLTMSSFPEMRRKPAAKSKYRQPSGERPGRKRY